MINVSETASEIMKNHLNNIGGDMSRQYSPAFQVKINENMRLAQIELINSYYDNMDEVTQARAKRTLKQIGG
jgi:hypothetical protein